jgi:hypothetical protein
MVSTGKREGLEDLHIATLITLGYQGIDAIYRTLISTHSSGMMGSTMYTDFTYIVFHTAYTCGILVVETTALEFRRVWRGCS